MAKTTSPTSKGLVMSMFRRGYEDDADEIPVGEAPIATRATAARETVPALPGKPLVLLIGAGKTGKSTFARWLAGEATEQGRLMLMAAIDGGNRTLARYFAGTEQPRRPNPEAPTDPNQAIPSRDPAVCRAFFADLVDQLMQEPTPTLVDCGGNDTVLPGQLDRTPKLAAMLDEAGVSPVALHFIGPRPDDLDALATLERRGFQPQPTALVLNQGAVAESMNPVEAFLLIRRHSAFRAAVERGAVVIEMPRLDPGVAAEIEQRELHFADVRDGRLPEGKKGYPIGGLRRSMVRRWMEEMGEAFAPIRPWLP